MSIDTPSPIASTDRTAGPSLFWLCAGLLLAGMGTVLLGPILPALSAEWHLPDYQAGMLLFAKFIGAFVGGATVPRTLRHGIFTGLIATCCGLTGFAYAQGLYTGALALFVTGIGLGQIIASTDILAGSRYTQRTGSALAFLNFFWSFGAVCIGIFIAALLPHHSLRELLCTFATVYVFIAFGGALRTARSPQPIGQTPQQESVPLPRSMFLSFGSMLFLYGGLETCLSQWITTYTVRYAGDGHILAGQSAIVVLWTALTVGRALSSLLMRFVRESTLQRASMIGCVILIPVLTRCTTASSLCVVCILMGLSLSAFFPSTFAQLLRRHPPARTAGFILAVSGLGAASMTWLMGIISSEAGSLRIAMVVPFLGALGLLAVSFWVPPLESTQPLFPKLPSAKFPEKASV